MKKYRATLLILGLAALLATAPVARAALNALDLNWWTVAGGGGESSGGSYTLHATVGQSAPGRLAGGVYTLDGGFWPGDKPLVKAFIPHVSR